jgi:hypothetical protein
LELFLIRPLVDDVSDCRTSGGSDAVSRHRRVGAGSARQSTESFAAFMDALDGISYRAAVEEVTSSEIWAARIGELLQESRRRIAIDHDHSSGEIPAAAAMPPCSTTSSPDAESGGRDEALLAAQVAELQRVLGVKEVLLAQLEHQLRISAATTSDVAGGATTQDDDYDANNNARRSIPLVFDDLGAIAADCADDEVVGVGMAEEFMMADAAAHLAHHAAVRPRTAGGVLLHPDAQLADIALATLPERPSYSPQSDEDDDDHDAEDDDRRDQTHGAAASTQSSQATDCTRDQSVVSATRRGPAASVTTVRFADVLLLSRPGRDDDRLADAGDAAPASHSSSHYFQPSQRSFSRAGLQPQDEEAAAAGAALLGVSPIRRHFDASVDVSSASPPPLSGSTPVREGDDSKQLLLRLQGNHQPVSVAAAGQEQPQQQQQRAPPTRGMVVRPSANSASSAGGPVDRPLNAHTLHFLSEFTGRGGAGGGGASRQQQQQHRTQRQQPVPRREMQFHEQRPQQRGAGSRQPPTGPSSSANTSAAAAPTGGIMSRQLGLGSLGNAVQNRSEIAHDAQLLRVFDDIHGGGDSSSDADWGLYDTSFDFDSVLMSQHYASVQWIFRHCKKKKRKITDPIFVSPALGRKKNRHHHHTQKYFFSQKSAKMYIADEEIISAHSSISTGRTTATASTPQLSAEPSLAPPRGDAGVTSTSQHTPLLSSNLLTIPCRYLCTTTVGGRLLHIYGGIVDTERRTGSSSSGSRFVDAQEVFESRQRALLLNGLFEDDDTIHMNEDAGLKACTHQNNEPQVRQKRSAILFSLDHAASDDSGAAAKHDNIQLMDAILAARMTSHVSFHIASATSGAAGESDELSASPLHPSAAGARMFLEIVSSLTHNSILASLSIDVDVFDLELAPSLSGTREERIEGLRRVLPLVARDIPVLSYQAAGHVHHHQDDHRHAVSVRFDLAKQHAPIFHQLRREHAQQQQNQDHVINSSTGSPRRRTLVTAGGNVNTSSVLGTIDTSAVLKQLYEIHPASFEVHVHLEDTFEHMVTCLTCPGYVATAELAQK